jgi:hypothetical protein
MHIYTNTQTYPQEIDKLDVIQIELFDEPMLAEDVPTQHLSRSIHA